MIYEILWIGCNHLPPCLLYTSPLYEKYADIIVEEEQMGVEDTVEALIEQLKD